MTLPSSARPPIEVHQFTVRREPRPTLLKFADPLFAHLNKFGDCSRARAPDSHTPSPGTASRSGEPAQVVRFLG